MADCDAPSFSLGLDLLLDSEPQIPVDPVNPEPQCDGEEGEELGYQVADSDPESRPERARVLRRLRRGLPPLRETTPSRCSNVEDEIEECSSQEHVFEAEPRPSAHYHSMCSSSKIPLHGCGAITTSQWKARKNEPASTVTASASTETSHDEKLSRKLTVSPLRRFQLIDSDSDSESDNPSTSEECIITLDNKINQSSKKKQSNPGVSATTSEQLRKGSDFKSQKEDLWIDFCPIKSFNISTPALDEVCEEYFRSVKNKKASEKLGSETFAKNCSDFGEPWNEAKPLFPAHRYFLHHDLRIQKLVRDRLPNFFPLGIDEDIRKQENCASAINYMGQFGNREPPKRQATQQVDLERSSKRGRNMVDPEQGKPRKRSTAKKSSGKCSNKSTGEVFQSWVDPKQGKGKQRSSTPKISKKGQNMRQASSAREGLHNSGSWVDPRSSASIKNDSVKGGSYSNGQSAGQWYTGSNGRKVYINKNGQELTGQIAYRQYKKDRGGFNKGKTKISSKKKKN